MCIYNKTDERESPQEATASNPIIGQ